MTIYDQVPAFVFPQDEVNPIKSDRFQRVGGMELRDYFAAQAMRWVDGATSAERAVNAYAEADAMMKVKHGG